MIVAQSCSCASGGGTGSAVVAALSLDAGFEIIDPNTWPVSGDSVALVGAFESPHRGYNSSIRYW